MLVKAGADLKNKDSNGNTPLHHAAIGKFKSCMDYLIEIGADLDEKNSQGLSPIELCDKAFASLFENKRLALAKANLLVKNANKTKGIETKPLLKKLKRDKEENKSTHLESAHSVSKSLFSSNKQKSVGPSDFLVHCLLGTGSFGDVYLVEKKDTKVLYAMKVLLKENIFSSFELNRPQPGAIRTDRKERLEHHSTSIHRKTALLLPEHHEAVHDTGFLSWR